MEPSLPCNAPSNSSFVDNPIPSTSQLIAADEATAAARDNPLSCYSSNFSYFAVGNEAEKLKWLVLQHVKPSTFKKVFAPLMHQDPKKRVQRSDELACVEACMLLQSLEPTDKTKPPTELEQACHGLIGLLNTEKIHLMALDRIITKIIITAAEQKIITLLLACQLLVTSIDFRMLKPPNPEKIKFVRKSMDQMDYKNMRDLLKLLLVEKLDKMHCQLTEYQHQQLVPIEELVIDLIDRRKNFCPALFFITEISRIDTDHSSIHFLPRVSLKIREMIASFRPLAEIGSMLGRSWMWPVPASPVFSWSSPTWSAWKLEEKHSKLYFKTHLPYSSENMSPQTYLQYILFKQPHGQDNLTHILRSPNSQLQCDEVIQLLILEAMCAMEDSEQPVLAPINQYNWLHLSHLVTYALWMGNCTLSQLLMMLLPQLRSCQYLRAKEELMWILLQFISYAKSKEKNQLQQQVQAQQAGGGIIPNMVGGLSTQNRELVLEIFNVLYGPDKSMNWGDTCSTEQPLKMVRFFSPAAIWINLVSSSAGLGADQLPQPQPPEKLRTLIDFIEKQLRDNKEQKQLEKNSALLAVIANAYSNNQELFDEHVNSTIFRMLGHNQAGHLQQPMQMQQQQADGTQKWALPGGRKTEPFLRALELNFLDSLTFHAKRALYNHSLKKVCMSGYLQFSQQQPTHSPLILKLPSPALVESIARLLLSTELCDQNGKIFYQSTLYTLKPHLTPESKELFFARSDLLAMFLELLNFRLQNIGFGWKWDIGTRITFLLNVLEQLILNKYICESSTPNHVQLCQLLEQTVLRFAQCTWPQDMLNTLQRLQMAMGKWLKNIPELCRAFLLSVFRAGKLLGDGQLQLSLPDLQMSLPDLGCHWPRCELQWFPQGVQQILYEQLAQNEQEWLAKHTQAMMELEQESLQEMQHLLHLDADYFRLTQPQSNPTQSVYNNSTLLISIFRSLYQYQLQNFQFPPPTKQPHPGTPNFPALCYKLLGTLGNRDLHKLTNTLVDWLAWKLSWLGQPQTPQTQGPEEYELHHMLKVLNDMLFVHQFLSIERFLFSIALHPTDDQSIRTLLCLLAALLDSKISQLPDRLHACYIFVPAHSQTTSSNSEDFFEQMAEYYKKYPELSFGELYRKVLNQAPPPDPTRELMNLPVYYGHLAERICPIVDILLQRALETEVNKNTLDTLLHHLSPIYRIHPQPMTFLYITLFSLDAILLAHQQQATNQGQAALANRPVRKFVLEIVLKLDQEDATPTNSRTNQISPPAGKLLTLEFIQQDHQMPPIKFCRVLVERIVQASTYTHQPPAFVHRDWRFAEFSPAAQALTSAWIELLASRHSPADIVEALVNLAIRRPISRPMDTLNALGLLLTGLPSSFQSAFLDKIEQSFDWDQLTRDEADPSQLFESLSHEVYLNTEGRILSMLALIHSFCQHGGYNSLSIIPDLIVQRLAPKVQNEAQLLYFLRIVVPYLQRIHEKERSSHMPEIVAIYQVLGQLTQKVGQLRYEDTICDLLYQFKYMFVGYSLKVQTEEAIRSFPDSMREKLKFLLTHSSSAVAAETQQQQMLQQQQQQLLHHQSSQRSLIAGSTALVVPMANTAAIINPQQQAAAISQYGQMPSTATSTVGQPHPPQQFAQISQQPLIVPPPLFGGPVGGGFGVVDAGMSAQPAALIGMLRRQSRESSGTGEETTGMPSNAGMMISSSAGSQLGMQQQHQIPKFPVFQSQSGGQPQSGQQQIAPPPPYSSQHSAVPGIPTMGPGGVPTTMFPGQVSPINGGGGQQHSAQFQQMAGQFAPTQMAGATSIGSFLGASVPHMGTAPMSGTGATPSRAPGPISGGMGGGQTL